ncbi:MAG: hypothetical protein F4Y94_10510 [Chloroflexi bacterium]|nr:hypothetical protein [Chloroflexota bacterium]
MIHEGDSVDDLKACAETLGVAAVYSLAGGEYVQYIVGAPEFVNESFRRLFMNGIPPATPLTVRLEESPPS